MDFNPPAGARVITAAQLGLMNPAETQETEGKVEYDPITGPVVIRGDIADKDITVTDGGLWIEGNVTNCNIRVDTKAINKAEWKKALSGEEILPSAIPQSNLDRLWKEAAQAGTGLHIKGNVTGCDDITAPNISITGNVVMESHDFDQGYNSPNRFVAPGGYVHIDGDVTGEEKNRRQCSATRRCYTQRTDGVYTLNPGETVESRMYLDLDRIEARCNVRISGNVSDCAIGTEEGDITIGGQKSGFVITGKQDTFAIESEPAKAVEGGAGRDDSRRQR